jgi:uncharacterized protein
MFGRLKDTAVPTASREFQVFAKPAGSSCNLACRYCYYLKAGRLYPQGPRPRMADRLLEEYIVQHIEASPGPVVTFSWHGGEPTVLGLDYFRRIVAIQVKHRPVDRRIVNGIQTNGLLLDEDWCRFLSNERFGVGLSLDGPPDLHDAYRVTRGQQPTHKEAVRAFSLLRRYKIPCDILCVVHDLNVGHPAGVYRFFKELGARYLGFLPLVEPAPDANGGVSTRSVPADGYGTFLCTIFDEWIREDVGRVGVQIFEETARAVRGHEQALCIFRETCGDVPVVEHNGDFYCCDHFVDKAHRLGNIQQMPLVQLLESPAQQAFGRAKLDTLPRCCRVCEVRRLCNGGCPKDRLVRAPDGEEGLNYLCAGLKRFFTHSLQYLTQLAAPTTEAAPPGRVVASTPATAGPTAKVGRNAPCPCGSGRKYKRCCQGR